MLEYKPIQFPADEFPHQNIIEWWYFNGQLFDANGLHYDFMDCLFKANPKKVKIPMLRLPLNVVYFSHSLLSDVTRQKFYNEISPLVFLSKDSFQKDLFFANYTNPTLSGYFNYEIEKIDEQTWHIKTQNFDLTLKNKRPPLLVGGKGYLAMKENTTYYYSLTDMETTGEIIIDGQRIKVTGKSWMDHQWADAVYSNFTWSWFSLQLKNQMEIVCFRFESKSGNYDLATVIMPDGSQKTFTDLRLEALGEKWESKKTGAVYPLSWKIEIPSLHLKLETKPYVHEQEMIFGLINYWEGGLNVAGELSGQAISGQGFMELVGYPSKKSKLNYYQKMIRHKIKNDLKHFLNKK
ncbi:MAG: lipocalin family protein [Candidatus Buchananbacteria bacterium]